LIGEKRRASRQGRAGDQQAGDAADDRERQRFDQKLLEDSRPSGAERRANGELFPARQRPREEQVAHVRAGDEQDQSHRGQQHHQRHSDVADDELL
jgi:hypothetical protein